MAIPPIFPNRQPATPSISVDTRPQTPAAPEAAKPTAQQIPFSPDEYDKIKTRAQKIVNDLSERDNDFKVKEQAFLIEPTSNKTAGARQLFDVTGQMVIKKMVGMFLSRKNIIPTIDVRNNQQGDPEKVEKFVRALLLAQQSVSSSSWIVDGFYSASIYGEVTGVIHKRLTGDAATDANLRVPFVFRVPHPRMSYPKYSSGIVGGLYRHVFTVTTTLGEVKEDYADAQNIEGDPDEVVTVYDYMDRVSRVHCVWLSEHADMPVLWANLPLGLETMPRACRLASDSPGFLEKEKDRRHGLLNSYVKSGLWAAFNTLYSVMYSNVFDYVDPDLVIQAANIERAAQIESELDWEARPMIIKTITGETLMPLAKQLIPPELMNFAQMAGYQRSDAMVPPIAGGTTPGGVFAASGLNLLSENATRSVNYLADVMSLLVADVVNDALQWTRYGEYQPRVWTEDGVLTLQAGDIGDCWVETTFQPDRQHEQQIISGIVDQMARLHMGAKDYLPLLERVQLIDSSVEAEKNMYEQAVLQAEITMAGKSVIEEAQRLNQAIAQVPDLNKPQQGVPPQGMQGGMPTNPAAPSPVPQGAMPQLPNVPSAPNAGAPIPPPVPLGQ